MGVAATDKMAVFSETLSVTARRVMRKPVLLPTILVFAAPALLGAGIVGRILRVLREGSLAGLGPWGERARGSLMLVALLVLALAPAVVSGLAVMADAVSQTDESVSGWTLFWKGLGKYYWRIVGAYAALIAVVVVGGIFLSIFAGPAILLSPSRDLVEPIVWVAVTMGTYFFGPWLAVAVVDDTGIVAAAPRSAKFAWKNPHVLAPAFVIQTVLSRIAEWITNFTVRDGTYRPPFWVPPGWFVAAAIGGALSGVVYVYFLVFRIYAYRQSVTPPPEPLPEPLPEPSSEIQPELFNEPLPGAPPEPPQPSDADQVAEDQDDRGENDQGVPPVAL